MRKVFRVFDAEGKGQGTVMATSKAEALSTLDKGYTVKGSNLDQPKSRGRILLGWSSEDKRWKFAA